MDNRILKMDHPSVELSVTYHQTTMHKLYASEQLDIGYYIFENDSFLYIDPIDEPMGYKTYALMKGRCMELRTKEILEKGSILLTLGSTEMTTLHMLEPTEFLVHFHCSKSLHSFKEKSVNMIALLSDLQEKDHYTKGHCDRVFELTKRMGLALSYHSKQIYNLNKAAHFHDIGKIFIEDDILNKPGTLTAEEFKRVAKHVNLGEDLVLSNYDQEIFQIIAQHHERIDGSGYPMGLKGDQIMEEARILAICDSYDAMVTDRVYKKGKSKEEALEELKELSGKLYDRQLVDLFVRIMTA